MTTVTYKLTNSVWSGVVGKDDTGNPEKEQFIPLEQMLALTAAAEYKGRKFTHVDLICLPQHIDLTKGPEAEAARVAELLKSTTSRLARLCRSSGVGQPWALLFSVPHLSRRLPTLCSSERSLSSWVFAKRVTVFSVWIPTAHLRSLRRVMRTLTSSRSWTPWPLVLRPHNTLASAWRLSKRFAGGHLITPSAQSPRSMRLMVVSTNVCRLDFRATCRT